LERFGVSIGARTLQGLPHGSIGRSLILAVSDDGVLPQRFQALWQAGYEVRCVTSAAEARAVLCDSLLPLSLLFLRVHDAKALTMQEWLLELQGSVPLMICTREAEDFVAPVAGPDAAEPIAARAADPPARVVVAADALGLRAALAVALGPCCELSALPLCPPEQALPRGADIVLILHPRGEFSRPLELLSQRFAGARRVCISAGLERAPFRIALEALHAQWPRRFKALPEFTRPVFAALDRIALDFRGLRIADLAARCSVSEGYLFRAFKTACGMSPKDFLSAVQVEAALQLLRFEAGKLESVAEEVGLCDASHLSRVFQRHGLQAPGRYRGQVDSVGSERSKIRSVPSMEPPAAPA
jgi:AraC-like DNA-binding protein